MKIKLTNYPYQEYQIGEIVDFGEEKNKSLVSFGRAVWVEDGVFVPVIDVKKAVKKVVKKAEDKKKEEADAEETTAEEETVLEVETEEETEVVGADEERVETEEESTDSNSFWNKFKAKKQSE